MPKSTNTSSPTSHLPAQLPAHSQILPWSLRPRTGGKVTEPKAKSGSRLVKAPKQPEKKTAGTTSRRNNSKSAVKKTSKSAKSQRRRGKAGASTPAPQQPASTASEPQQSQEKATAPVPVSPPVMSSPSVHFGKVENVDIPAASKAEENNGSHTPPSTPPRPLPRPMKSRYRAPSLSPDRGGMFQSIAFGMGRW